MARTKAGIGGGRYHIRQWGVPAMVTGAGHHSLHADAGQCAQKEEPLLRPRTFYLSPRKQQLSLSCGAAPQLRRSQRAEPHLSVYRYPQTLWRVLAKNAMHQRSIPVSRHPHGSACPATRTRGGPHARVREGTAGKKEGGSTVRGT